MTSPRSGRGRRIVRRLVTIPAYLAVALLVWAALPLLLAAAILIDLATGRPLLVSRLILVLAAYLACEVAGLVGAAGLWLVSLTGRLHRDRWLDAHWRMQSWWAGAIFGAIRRTLRFEVRVEGSELATPGPVVVFIRHASIMDALLPSVIVGPSGLHLRYVLKKELQWDPCLDVVGNRLPNAFVDRESPDSRAEIALVCDLAHEMGPSDGILIYPEGTRFTPAKRQRALERLSKGDPSLLRRAEVLRHVLPPKLGGPLGLLEANPSADVIFMAHVGLDGLARVRHLWDPSLVGRRIRVKLWRVGRDRIPEDRTRRSEWLFDEWTRVDRWVAENLETGS